MSESERDSGFPALMLQLAFVVSQNPRYARRSQIRAILMVELNCETKSKKIFLNCCKVLRLEVDSILCVQDVHGKFDWLDVIQEEEKVISGDEKFGAQVGGNKAADSSTDIIGADGSVKGIARAKRFNELLREHSKDTYITFFELPDIPPIVNGDSALSKRLGHCWLLHLLTLVNNMPCPIAFVKTGEIDPVISTAM